MRNNRIWISWLLLLALVLGGAFPLTAGASTNDKSFSSNCLVTKDDPARTVLVGEISLSRSTDVTFWMKSNGASASGQLAWGISNPEYAKYLTISMRSGTDAIEPNMEIDLLEDTPMNITMGLKPTMLATDTEHGPLKIHVLVTWGDEMWGTFQVMLPAVREEEERPAPTDPPATKPTASAETQPPQKETEPVEVVETEPAEVTETEAAEVTETEAVEVMETEAAEVMETEAAEVMETEAAEVMETEAAEVMETEAVEVTETEPVEAPQADPKGATEEASLPWDSETEALAPVAETEETTAWEDPMAIASDDGTEAWQEPTESETEAAAQPTGTLQLRTFSNTDIAGKLPMRLELTKDVTSVRLGMEASDGEDLTMGPLPDDTMFSLDGDSSYYMMYRGFVAEFSVKRMTSLPLLLDFRYTKLMKNGGEITLAIETFAGNRCLASCRKTFTIQPRNASQPERELWEGITPQSDAEPVLYQDSPLEFALPDLLRDAKLEYSVERLTTGENGSQEYQPAALSDDGLSVTYTNHAKSHTLTARVGNDPPQEGIYRISMLWKYEGICFAKKQLTFTLDHSA